MINIASKLNNNLATLTFFRRYTNHPTMPFRNNIITDAHTQTRSTTSRLGSEEWLEYFVYGFWGHADAVVFNGYQYIG